MISSSQQRRVDPRRNLEKTEIMNASKLADYLVRAGIFKAGAKGWNSAWKHAERMSQGACQGSLIDGVAREMLVLKGVANWPHFEYGTGRPYFSKLP